ncbi:MAG TPA: Nif3-like dinuclear metal center hexameric protein [Dehalococcoidia bacterium]|nr:Nif3-like dinuclear metal center hexameric protein [Dehalococcoidia bacterium]
MRTADVAAGLDEFFRMDDFPPDDFAEIEAFCEEAGIPLADYATPAFMRRHNGLMVTAYETQLVYTVVFPSDELIAEIERLAYQRPTLIFTHHPMDFETSGRGLVPISSESLERMKNAGISLYSAHAPLDCHPEVSTSRALARAIGVPVDGTFAEYYGGHAGVFGEIGETQLAEFVAAAGLACGVERVDSKRYSGTARRVAVCAGGAALPELMQEAVDLGCDTYVTGDYRVRHGGPWAEEHRPRFDGFLEAVPLNLVGASHFATEAIVLKTDVIELFAEMGLEAQFVGQDDPWR